jgi:hypothetical protein
MPTDAPIHDSRTNKRHGSVTDKHEATLFVSVSAALLAESSIPPKPGGESTTATKGGEITQTKVSGAPWRAQKTKLTMSI